MPSARAHPFGARARTAREALGLHQAEVAERVGISIEVYGRFERGTVTPRIATLLMMCEVLHLEPNDLLLGPDAGGPRGKRAESVPAGMARLVAVLDGADDETIQRVTDVARRLLPNGTSAAWRRSHGAGGDRTAAVTANETKSGRTWNASRRAPVRRTRG